MAVFNAPQDPYMAAKSDPSSGLNQILDMMLQKQSQQKQRKQQSQQLQQALQSMGMNEGQSQALGGLDPKMLSVLLGMRGKEGQSGQQLQQTMSGLIGLGYSPEEAMQLSMLPPQVLTAAFRSRGFLPGKGKKAKTVAKGKKLTNKIVDHFLQKTGGDPKKARQLAEKAGYKV